MPSPNLPSGATALLVGFLKLPIGVVKYAANEPIITGGLLYLLTRGPPHLRERLLGPFQNNLLANNGAGRLAMIVTALKVLAGLGIWKRINRALNAFALNGWRFSRAGASFEFGPAKTELVVITGACSGFGFEMVKGFSEKARIVALDISPFPAELARLPDVHYYQCDVSDSAAIVKVCEEVRKAHGNASVLINNAGIGIGKTVLETTNEECEKLFKVNLISHFALIREFLPGMLEMRKGHIVTIASMASFYAAPGILDYCCSKVGVLYLNDGLRGECLTRYEGGEAICTSSIHPTWHRTRIIKGFEKTLEKRGFAIHPAVNVSNVVVDQVLRGKSGRIHVPLSEESFASLRSWPLWLQDIVLGYAWRPRKGHWMSITKT
ncbi:NAD(P)-binding protein [Lojkania enalia]|uniref:NAD(P)-binding protein n=1 Tax=Lojkania enalia TaxID=147567 RepID=A0A9P4N922_9PLEO|nr:NAD(P)-binding protein [Didymosphaeria enalia]